MPKQLLGAIGRLPAFDRKAKHLNTVVEAVRGSRNKFKFDPSLHLFVHDNSLPPGSTYPFDFGFIPGTKGADGDPVDVLILMDEPAFPGAVVPGRLIGGIEHFWVSYNEQRGRTFEVLGVIGARAATDLVKTQLKRLR